MDITVPKSLEALVRRKVDEGHYSTEDEVVADALRLMQARDEVAQIKRARLQDAIDRGYQDVTAGNVIRLESDDQIDAFFAGKPIQLVADRAFRLSANLCRRIGDVDLYHQWIRNSLESDSSPWWSAAFATTALVGYFSAGKSLLDAGAVALDHLLGLGFRPKQQDFSKGKFWNKLQTADGNAYERLRNHRPFIDEVVRWRDASVHRLPPRVRVLSDGPPAKTPVTTTKQDVRHGMPDDPGADMMDMLLGKKLTWVDPLELVDGFTKGFHSFASDIADILLTKLGSNARLAG